MARPSRDLTAAQVRQVRTQAEASGRALCADPTCPNAPADDGATTPEDAGYCSLHRQKRRNARGACPNCGNAMQQVPIINSITGLPRTSASSRTHQQQCVACGYTQQQRHTR